MGDFSTSHYSQPSGHTIDATLYHPSLSSTSKAAVTSTGSSNAGGQVATNSSVPPSGTTNLTDPAHQVRLRGQQPDRSSSNLTSPVSPVRQYPAYSDASLNRSFNAPDRRHPTSYSTSSSYPPSQTHQQLGQTIYSQHHSQHSSQANDASAMANSSYGAYDTSLNSQSAFNPVDGLTGYNNSSARRYYTDPAQQHPHQTHPTHQANQQQSFHSGSGPSNDFGVPSAGPPSPNKMDMLPHGSSQPYHSSHAHTYEHHQKPKTRAQEVYEPLPNPRGPTVSKGSSTTSEFTKRKNWSQRIVEEMQDVLHVLSPQGVFLFVSPSIADLSGYTAEELLGKDITSFIHNQDLASFVKAFSHSLNNNVPMTTYLRFKKKPGSSSSDSGDKKPSIVISTEQETLLFEVTGQPYYSDSDAPVPSGTSGQNGIINFNENATLDGSSVTSLLTQEVPKGCKCFFGMARPYPSKNNAMLDSFLELKIENEKLRQELSDVYKEIEGEYPNETNFPIQQSMGLDGQLGGMYRMDGTVAGGDRQISGFPHRAQPGQQGADPSLYYSYPTFAREGSNPYFYQQPSAQQQPGYGEVQSPRGSAVNQANLLVSSAGLIPSNSNTYGALGIGISASARNSHTSHHAGQADGAEGDDKKKKQKKQRVDEGDFVCRDCGTVDSPEWRRGPLGPKTLCNACGLRWAKKNKQMRNSMGGVEGQV